MAKAKDKLEEYILIEEYIKQLLKEVEDCQLKGYYFR